MSAIQENISLLPFNTFHLDVKARYLVEMEDVNQVQDFFNSRFAKITPRFVLGGGSNVLFTADYEGLIIRPVIKGIRIIREDEDSVYIRAGAGENWDSFVGWCISKDLGGVENLSLIPGTVGASPIQNIGAYGVEVKEVIQSVEAVNCETGKTIVLEGSECQFGYRDSLFKRELRDKVIITYVTYKLDKKHVLKVNYADLKKVIGRYPCATISAIREAVINIRRNKLPDPDEIGNAGSFFKNPVIEVNNLAELKKNFPDIPAFSVNSDRVKLSAAWLIDQCGWKGKKVGNTGTYEKQPLILVNHGGADGKEILNFARSIQKSVMEKFDIRLQMEVNVV